MKKTTVRAIKNDVTVSYLKPICFIGSCFSDEMSIKCKKSGFKVIANLFGVIFNPLSIFELINRSMEGSDFNDVILKQNDVYLSWLANRTIFSYDRNSLGSLLKQNATTFRNGMSESETLFITFGTAWVYKLKESNQVVANCHKHPQELFQKVMLTADDIIASYRLLLRKVKDTYPHLNIVFTVSPVRHVKDGLIENNLSKSHLISAVHQLVSEFDFVNYFPSYEIVTDELRDYAFYKSDGIHPNKIAIDIIWNRFKNNFFDDKTLETDSEFERIRLKAEHRHFHEKSVETIEFNNKLRRQLVDFKLNHPDVQLTTEMEELI